LFNVISGLLFVIYVPVQVLTCLVQKRNASSIPRSGGMPTATKAVADGAVLQVLDFDPA
jgi:hypothetical protein